MELDTLNHDKDGASAVDLELASHETSAIIESDEVKFNPTSKMN
jgi:hypothetical protein